MKVRIIFSVLLASACLASHAQVIFQDGFEAYTDVNQMYNEASWYLEPTQLDGESRPQIGTIVDGILPHTGAQQLEFRASAVGDHRRLSHYAHEQTSAPFTKCSVWFAFGPSSVERQEFGIEVRTPMGTVRAYLNETRSTLALGTKTTPAVIETGKWYKFSCVIDWSAKEATVRIDNQAGLSMKFFGSNQVKSISQFMFALKPLESTLDKYSLYEGAPGVCIDDYQVAGVPDSSTVVSLALGSITVLLRNRHIARRRDRSRVHA